MSVSYCTLNGEFPGKRLKGAKRYEKLNGSGDCPAIRCTGDPIV